MEQGGKFSNVSQLYTIIEPLGRGAYSCVYKVQSRKTNNYFALKIIDKQKLNQNHLRKRLQNEIQIQSQLRHKNIVHLFEYYEDEQNVYLILELCAGGELFTYIKSEGRLSEEECRGFSNQLLEGISYMHSYRIMHRDLKMGNVLLSEDKTTVKIADFGLAVQLRDLEEERNTLCGTPNYISPEVVSRQPYGLSSDIWALGCIVYACLIGHPPFESPSVQDTLLRLKEMQYALPSFLSSQAKSLITSLLTWDPQSRPDISQVKLHPFFQNKPEPFANTSQASTLPSDCSYYEYSEPLVSPRFPLMETKRPLRSNTARPSSARNTPMKNTSFQGKENSMYAPKVPPKSSPKKISPINTFNLKPLLHRIRNGEIEISRDGWVRLQIGRRKLEVSRDGMTVLYQGRPVNTKTMSPSATRLYEYVKNFIEVVKSKTPKVVVEEQNCTCMLMQNSPFPNFEANFRNGVRVTYQVGCEEFVINAASGFAIKVNPYQDLDHLDAQTKQVLDASMDGLKKCLSKERYMAS